MYIILIAFPQQQWFRESALTLRYTYIVCHILALLDSNQSQGRGTAPVGFKPLVI
jgi:hypothetical protein